MSSSTNNITQNPWDWNSGYGYDNFYAPNNNRNSRRMPTVPQSRRSAFQARPDANRGGAQNTLRPATEERAMTEPLGLAGYPLSPPPPVQVLILNTGVARQIPAPRLIGQRNLQASASTQSDFSRLTQDERNRALKKLKKEAYNPIPKRISSRLSWYYRDRSNMDVFKERAQGTEDDGKRCAVCLDDFEPKELVMLTPCNHMFHEECIVPWVKSNGQCPVCRFVLCDQARGSAAPTPNIQDFVANDISEGELISVIRAMEEAFIRGNTSRW
ncbi:unnamed protein product [Dovyalis caffra]|uniref:RING-type domain-containing protein n=1 Tax=Dovyalis caffra TaxID=77055 RepID=A0AAV1S9R6_9ROSI|nr:unnamed protein product [Dovyalis caffra]